ncbi:2-hydroxy-palmitic acid dioxygenase MPO1-like [Carex rostrata]
MAKQLIDLETHFAVYTAHHTHPVNSIAHTLLVWPSLFSIFMLLHLTPPIIKFPVLGQLDLAFVLATVYCVTYLLLDRKAGFLASILCIFCLINSGSLVNRLGFPLSLKVALPLQLFCTTGPAIGHGAFEKQAPAAGYLPHVYLMEPFFIFLEALHKLFNYEPYPCFYANVNKKIESNLKQWQTTKLWKMS